MQGFYVIQNMTYPILAAVAVVVLGFLARFLFQLKNEPVSGALRTVAPGRVQQAVQPRQDTPPIIPEPLPKPVHGPPHSRAHAERPPQEVPKQESTQNVASSNKALRQALLLSDVLKRKT